MKFLLIPDPTLRKSIKYSSAIPSVYDIKNLVCVSSSGSLWLLYSIGIAET